MGPGARPGHIHTLHPLLRAQDELRVKGREQWLQAGGFHHNCEGQVLNGKWTIQA